MPIFSLRPRRQRVYGGVRAVTRPGGPRRRPTVTAGRVLRWAFALGAVLFIGGTVSLAWLLRELPNPEQLTRREVPESTRIYDRTGEHLLYEAYQDTKRTVVPLSDISPWLVRATIAVEDKYFYEHRGVRLPSIARAAVNNLLGRRTGAGGASTITQQLIKNAVVGSEHSYWRKLREAVLALRLERTYSKDKILELYLNEVSYGATNYGVEAAARAYFRASAKDLTLPQAAALAALTRAPSRYLGNPQALRERRDLVLRLMHEQGYISEEVKTEAANQALRLYRAGTGLSVAPHFVLYVEELLAERFGQRAVDSGGLKVITTLDYNWQMAAERIIKEQGAKLLKEAGANNAALVALDPATGQIVAYVGSRDYNNDDIDGKFDVVRLSRLQPGSSLKPLVYTLAFARGFTPETVIYDVATDFDVREGAEKYAPRNYDGKDHGLVTLRTALQGSLNIASVKLLYLVGPEAAIEFARRFGYTTFGDPSRYGLSLVLGGAEVNPLEHTAGYAALANQGTYLPPSAILKVEKPNGAALYEWQPPEGTEATTPELAALITNVLTDDDSRAFIFGRRGNLTLPDRPVAAKTGTTNENKDAWTLGYVPQLAAGVWVGNSTPAPMKLSANRLAAVIWNQFMRAALASTTPENFPPPLPSDTIKPVLSGSNGGIRVRINKLTGKIAASTTPDSLVEVRTYLPPHDIIHYVDREDPRGAPPDLPTLDPQYENWEAALQRWIEREQARGNSLTLEEPPTEYDEPGGVEFLPAIEITSPASGTVIMAKEFDLAVKTSAPRGVAAVSYELDGVALGASTEFPFSLRATLTEVEPGPHRLRAIATDTAGASSATEVSVVVGEAFDPPSARWADASPLALAGGDYPREMKLKVFRWSEARELKIYLVSPAGKKLIYTFLPKEDAPINGALSFTWRRSPGVGAHQLQVALADQTGAVSESELEVEVKK